MFSLRVTLGGLNNVLSSQNTLNGVDVITRVMVSVLDHASKRSATSQAPQTRTGSFTPSPAKVTASTLSDSLSNLSLCTRTADPDHPTPTHARTGKSPRSSENCSSDSIPIKMFHRSVALAHLSPTKSTAPKVSQMEPSSPGLILPTWSHSDQSEINFVTIASRTSSMGTSSHIPHTNAGSTLDLLEAGFRCLSHLTAGHPEAVKAVAYFYQQRLSSHLVGTVVIHVLLPLLSPTDSSPFDSERHKSSENLTDRPHRIQTLQLIRAWATLLNNLCALAPIASSPTTTITARGRRRFLHHGSKCVYTRLPKSLVSQLRRSVRPLDQSLTELAALVGHSLGLNSRCFNFTQACF
ncbi:unnamed protein product [Echinostoma caproni]|uniref:Ras-GAP domain-containing protein n=1 Tax=Echinostoma caproni TaxID=27848 RepID=A0A183AI96_9TREM|nr:unnamed protein product [Echinostoma caproni]